MPDPWGARWIATDFTSVSPSDAVASMVTMSNTAEPGSTTETSGAVQSGAAKMFRPVLLLSLKSAPDSWILGQRAASEEQRADGVEEASEHD